MPFDVGDKVVYPHHGAAVIEKREKIEAFGEKKEYLILRLAYGDALELLLDSGEDLAGGAVLGGPGARLGGDGGRRRRGCLCVMRTRSHGCRFV